MHDLTQMHTDAMAGVANGHAIYVSHGKSDRIGLLVACEDGHAVVERAPGQRTIVPLDTLTIREPEGPWHAMLAPTNVLDGSAYFVQRGEGEGALYGAWYADEDDARVLATNLNRALWHHPLDEVTAALWRFAAAASALADALEADPAVEAHALYPFSSPFAPLTTAIYDWTEAIDND